jgi:hypothetical protein
MFRYSYHFETISKYRKLLSLTLSLARCTSSCLTALPSLLSTMYHMVFPLSVQREGYETQIEYRVTVMNHLINTREIIR